MLYLDIVFLSLTQWKPPLTIWCTAEVRLPSDNLLMDASHENIELIYLQRNLDVWKHSNTRQRLISKLNTRTSARYSATDDNFRERSIKIGDLVLRKFDGRPTKLHPKWDGPFIVKDSTPEGVYTLMTSNGHVLRMNYNASKLKKFSGSQSDFFFALQELHRRDNNAKRATTRNTLG